MHCVNDAVVLLAGYCSSTRIFSTCVSEIFLFLKLLNKEVFFAGLFCVCTITSRFFAMRERDCKVSLPNRRKNCNCNLCSSVLFYRRQLGQETLGWSKNLSPEHDSHSNEGLLLFSLWNRATGSCEKVIHKKSVWWKAKIQISRLLPH